MSIEEIRSSYAECADWLYRVDRLDRAITGRYRRELFGDADGDVLDVACGTGTNFEYLPESAEPIGIDVSREMLAKARRRLERLGRDGTLREMDAEALAFADDQFDTVISSLSTCTFPNPVTALEEMSRVCKPDGEILLLEHGRSDIEPIGRFQDWRADSHYDHAGCRWDQEPLEHVLDAGLPIHSVRTEMAGIVTSIEAGPAQDSLGDALRAHVPLPRD